MEIHHATLNRPIRFSNAFRLRVLTCFYTRLCSSIQGVARQYLIPPRTKQPRAASTGLGCPWMHVVLFGVA